MAYFVTTPNQKKFYSPLCVGTQGEDRPHRVNVAVDRAKQVPKSC